MFILEKFGCLELPTLFIDVPAEPLLVITGLSIFGTLKSLPFYLTITFLVIKFTRHQLESYSSLALLIETQCINELLEKSKEVKYDAPGQSQRRVCQGQCAWQLKSIGKFMTYRRFPRHILLGNLLL